MIVRLMNLIREIFTEIGKVIPDDCCQPRKVKKRPTTKPNEIFEKFFQELQKKNHQPSRQNVNWLFMGGVRSLTKGRVGGAKVINELMFFYSHFLYFYSQYEEN